MNDLVIISPDERGFWHADLYCNFADVPVDEFECIAPAPDNFLTRKSLFDTEAAAKVAWPNAKIEFAQEEENEDE